MADDKKQRLVHSVIDFLNESIADGTVKEEDKESLEVAIQCIGEAFGVDPDNEEQSSKLSIKPAKLSNIFDVFLKSWERTQGSGSTPAAASPPHASAGPKGPSAADKAEADKLKLKGNALMTSKKYDEAINEYTKAIDLDSTNPVFYSNRAAAFASKGDHLSAIGDAEQAISIDPKFVKAYSRLGHAQYSIGDYPAAVSAFERGLELEPTNSNLKNGLDNAKSRIPSSSSAAASDNAAPATRSATGAGGAPNFNDLLTGLGGAGGAGGAPNFNDILGSLGGGGAGGSGGMPDLSSLLNNPALMRMASQMAQNGGLNDLLQNPNVAEMANRFRTGDVPSMDELLSDPTLRSMAEQFGQGGA